MWLSVGCSPCRLTALPSRLREMEHNNPHLPSVQDHMRLELVRVRVAADRERECLSYVAAQAHTAQSQLQVANADHNRLVSEHAGIESQA